MLAILAGLLRPEWATWVITGSVGLAALGSVVYSYFLWREEHEAARANASHTEAGR